MSVETLGEQKKVTARKEHKCSYCRLKIAIGDKYFHSVHKYDGTIYTWKSHGHCIDIAHKLRMYDDADEGVTDEIFCETISEHYRTITSETQTELYESDDFKYPSFEEELLFVLNHHKIQTPQGE